MKSWDMGRALGIGVVSAGLTFQASPIAWAQLREVDPALDAAVEALVTADPELVNDSELAQLCRQVAESTVTDIRERVAVTQEVAVMHRDGIDAKTVIPDAVRETVRERFAAVQGQMREQLETLRATDPEKAKEFELRMREGERQMIAFETGEHYTPSTEMVAHAQEMFKNWESDMVSRGAPQEFLERARMEMARYSSGEMAVAFGGSGHEFAGPGPGGGMPSVEQMQAMGMSAEQIQMAQAHPEGMATGRTYSEMMAGNAVYGDGSNYGINPATGGWEPNMGGGPPSAYMPEGWAQNQSGDSHFVGDWGPSSGAHVGYTDWSAGGGTFTSWEGGSNYGINPATGGWEPGMGGGTTYGGGTTDWSAGGGPSTGGWTQDSGGHWVPDFSYAGSGYSTADSQAAAAERAANATTVTQERTEYVNHVHGDNSIHQHEIHIHTDGVRHDHTAPGSGL